MLGKLDDAQLRVWQYLVNLYGKYTGRSHFELVRFGLVVYVAGSISMWMMAEEYVLKLLLGAFVVFIVIATPFAFWLIANVEKAAQKGLANTERLSGASQINRVMQTVIVAQMLLRSTLTWSFDPSDAAVTGLWAAFHLLACDLPPPPKEEESVDNLVVSGA